MLLETLLQFSQQIVCAAPVKAEAQCGRTAGQNMRFAKELRPAARPGCASAPAANILRKYVVIRILLKDARRTVSTTKNIGLTPVDDLVRRFSRLSTGFGSLRKKQG